MGPLEKDVEGYLVQEIKKLGGKAYKVISPGNNGFPDRLSCLPGNRMQLIETKKPKGKPRKLQKVQIRFLRSLGIEVLVIDTKELVDTYINIMREEIKNDRQAFGK